MYTSKPALIIGGCHLRRMFIIPPNCSESTVRPVGGAGSTTNNQHIMMNSKNVKLCRAYCLTYLTIFYFDSSMMSHFHTFHILSFVKINNQNICLKNIGLRGL